MPLHLIKLCVGAASIEDLIARGPERESYALKQGYTDAFVHTTRQMPRRRDEVLDGGSLYWVIKGNVQARQRILDLVAITAEDGLDYCQILLSPEVVRTAVQPRRPFQGWRYLDQRDAPPDTRLIAETDSEIDVAMRRDLIELGLL